MAIEDTLRAIRLSQVVFLLIDAQAPLEKQDFKLLIVNSPRVVFGDRH